MGDELGFGQSLSNVEALKRRSVQTSRIGSSSYTNLVSLFLFLLNKRNEFLIIKFCKFDDSNAIDNIF